MDEQIITPPENATPEPSLNSVPNQNPGHDGKNPSGNKTLIIVISVAVFLFAVSIALYFFIFSSTKKAALNSEPTDSQTANESAKQAGDTQSSLEYQLKNKIFEAGLPKEKITEVHIGGYAVPAGTLETIQAAIQQKIGVPVTIDSNYPEEIPKDAEIYNESRQQFDGDAMWQNSSGSFEANGDTKRYLVIINEDMFTKIQPERLYIMSRAIPKTNNAMISVKRLQNFSDASTEPASAERYKERVGKLAVRVLGVTAGLSLTPDADNINCLMYQSSSIDELDKVGTNFCETTKNALDRVFLIQN
jgi:predicted Zn-dependent protease